MEFSPKGYHSILESALKAEYKFLFFEEKNLGLPRFCLLRHDIDADLNAASQMAKIEKDLGIKSTYFIMLRSPVYNLFGRANHRFVEEILKNGHAIGLHYDEGFYPSKYENLQELIEKEADVLEAMFGYKITTVSFHQPGQQVINNSITVKGFINTYDKKDMEGVHYVSDSNMIWKDKTPWEFFPAVTYPKIQLLIHPMWWVGDGSQNTEILWDKTIRDNVIRSLDQIEQTERAFGKRRDIKIR